jgi:ribosomal protein S18 acetylase RimI-like enzyme
MSEAHSSEAHSPLTWTDHLADVDWDQLAPLYRAASMGEKAPADLKVVFGNSMFRVFVSAGGQLVGAGRVLADGRDCAYLCDVAVLPSHQGRGLGQQIVEELVRLSRGHRKIILYAVPGTEPFYERFGFRRMTTAMAIFDNPAAAAARGLLRDA